MAKAGDIGCLLIDDPLYGGGGLDDLRDALIRQDIRTERFTRDRSGPLHPSMQRAYQRVRRDGAVNAIIAMGAGCDCALALSCQLPADRLVLLEPMNWNGVGESAREMKRVRAFARRNAAFCVADVLILPGPHTEAGHLKRLLRALTGCRVAALQSTEELWTNRKEVLNLGIIHFLREGVVTKSLAENHEMCIIYG